ncbi:hypothetical protein HJG60_008436 [Phyllostomus discolor]|uniref:Uncharacterized protein n=1 Tax=Phyllostomus discolor TaxID=89673 RepID=A0A834DM92_9CHIR|nr:hypothetical protein HJG60_008436 [Phyllostomus discolor]
MPEGWGGRRAPAVTLTFWLLQLTKHHTAPPPALPETDGARVRLQPGPLWAGVGTRSPTQLHAQDRLRKLGVLCASHVSLGGTWPTRPWLEGPRSTASTVTNARRPPPSQDRDARVMWLRAGPSGTPGPGQGDHAMAHEDQGVAVGPEGVPAAERRGEDGSKTPFPRTLSLFCQVTCDHICHCGLWGRLRAEAPEERVPLCTGSGVRCLPSECRFQAAGDILSAVEGSGRVGQADLQELPSGLSRPCLRAPGGPACFRPPELGGGRLSLTGARGPTSPQPQSSRHLPARLWQCCGLSPAPSAVTGWGAASGSARSSGSPLWMPSTGPSVPQGRRSGPQAGVGWASWTPREVVQVRGEELGPGGAGGPAAQLQSQVPPFCAKRPPRPPRRASSVTQRAAPRSTSWSLWRHTCCRCRTRGGDRVGAVPGRWLVSRWLPPSSDSGRPGPSSLGQRGRAGVGLQLGTQDSETGGSRASSSILDAKKLGAQRQHVLLVAEGPGGLLQADGSRGSQRRLLTSWCDRALCVLHTYYTGPHARDLGARPWVSPTPHLAPRRGGPFPRLLVSEHLGHQAQAWALARSVPACERHSQGPFQPSVPYDVPPSLTCKPLPVYPRCRDAPCLLICLNCQWAFSPLVCCKEHMQCVNECSVSSLCSRCLCSSSTITVRKQ